MALSVAMLGDNSLGYRLPSILLGMVSIIAFYRLTLVLAGSERVALLATFLLSFDNLFYLHSRIAMLDIYVVAFMIIGFYMFFVGRRTLAALFTALSTLSKIVGVMGFVALCVFELLKPLGNRSLKARLDSVERLALDFFIIFLGLLSILDYVSGGFVDPLDHLYIMYAQLKSINRPYLEGFESYPWQWLLNEVKIPYFVSGTLAFIGAMNPAVIFLTVPSMMYLAYRFWMRKDQASLLALVWFIFTFVPFILIFAIWNRITYIFYFLISLPSVCLAISCAIHDAKYSKIVTALYVITVIIGFWSLFPFKMRL